MSAFERSKMILRWPVTLTCKFVRDYSAIYVTTKQKTDISNSIQGTVRTDTHTSIYASNDRYSLGIVEFNVPLDTFVLHQHSVLSKICSRLIYFFIHFNNYQLNLEKRMLYSALDSA